MPDECDAEKHIYISQSDIQSYEDFRLFVEIIRRILSLLLMLL